MLLEPSHLTLTAIALVLTASLCHASWNMIVRNTTRPALTTPLMALASACIASPLAVYILVTDMPSATGWAFIAATIVLHIAYFSALGYAYASGELSVVYPIARGLGLAIIPVLGGLRSRRDDDTTGSRWRAFDTVGHHIDHAV